MATVLVVTSSPPFAEGGHLVMARELVRALEESGHAASVLVTPQNRFGRQGAAYLAAWCTDVGVAHEGRTVDQVITLRFPAYAVRHDRHVVWLNHRMREYYDLWDQFAPHLSFRAGIKERMRRAIIHRVDRYLLNRVQRRYVISGTVQARLQRWGGIQSDVLHVPPPRRDYRCHAHGDYLFAVSRLTPHKRMDLILRALAEPSAAGIRCVIAGEGGELDALLKLRRQLDLDDRVEFVGRIDDAQPGRSPRALPRRRVHAIQRGLRFRHRRRLLQPQSSVDAVPTAAGRRSSCVTASTAMSPIRSRNHSRARCGASWRIAISRFGSGKRERRTPRE